MASLHSIFYYATMIFILIAVLSLVGTSIVELCHSNDKGWEKTKAVQRVESVAIMLFVSAILTTILAVII